MPTPDHCLSLILGGARSGKSTFAERLVTSTGTAWTYIATAEPFDDEMRHRIGEHRDRRAAGWTTVDAPLALADAIAVQMVGDNSILVDCLTVWLSNLMLAERAIEAETDRLLHALSAERRAPIVVVSNEVGLGIVPDNALARRFRDAQGRLNQRVAAIADHVVLMAAGLPLVLKDTSKSGQTT